MSKRGPGKTPTITLKARGSWRANTQERNQEVKPEINIPGMPDWLSAQGRREWMRLTPILAQHGLLTRLDGNTLGTYCEAVAQYLSAKKYCDAIVQAGDENDDFGSRLLIKTRNGNVIQNPAFSIMNRALEQMNKIGQKFGMSPSDRAGLSISPVAKPASDKKITPFKIA